MSFTTATEVSSTTSSTEYFLNANHRCDKCSAQGYYRAELTTGYLIFCRHHFKESEVKLREISLEILDESDRLVQKKPMVFED